MFQRGGIVVRSPNRFSGAFLCLIEDESINGCRNFLNKKNGPGGNFLLPRALVVRRISSLEFMG